VDAACQIRGPLDAPKFKDYILPLIFVKRLSDVFDDEVSHLAHEFGDRKTAAKLVEFPSPFAPVVKYSQLAHRRSP